MKTFIFFLASFLAACCTVNAQPAGRSPFEYISPVPGSVLNSRNTTIAFRPAASAGAAEPGTFAFHVTGSASGEMTGRVILADDRRTLIFKPDGLFEAGERVSVTIAGDLQSRDGVKPVRHSFSFQVTPLKTPIRYNAEKALASSMILPSKPDTFTTGGNNLPAGFPQIKVNHCDNPAPGYTFMAPFAFPVFSSYLTVLDNKGIPLFARHFNDSSMMLDFKIQPTGVLTFYGGLGKQFWVLNDRFEVIDSFATGNGYFTDMHELQLTMDGHAWLMSYDPQIIGMDTVVPGGNPQAQVFGLIIQELDQSKNVVFQWRSWDHMLITDGVYPLVDLTDSIVDYVHGNAIEVASDTNILISSRHIEEITNIDRRTGEIIWRLGSNHAKNNHFTFINDTITFSAQHDIRYQPDGHYTLFDNGNLHSVPCSSANEYSLDPVSMTATLVKRQCSDPNIFGAFMGNVHHFSDSNYLVGWGGGIPNITEFRPDGTKALEFQFPMLNYRAFKFNWKNAALVTTTTALDFDSIPRESAKSMEFYVRNNTGHPMTLTSTYNYDTTFKLTTPLPAVISPNDSILLSIRFSPGETGEYSDTFTINSDSVSGQYFSRIAVQVELKGKAGFGLGIPASQQSGIRIYPNPTTGRVTVEGLPEGSPFRVTVVDASGRIILETRIQGTHAVLDLSGNPPGQYGIRVTDPVGGGSRLVKVIMN